RVRIFVRDRLKQGLGSLGPLLHGTEGGHARLLRGSRRNNGGIVGAESARHGQTGRFVLLLQVIVPSQAEGDDYGGNNAQNGEDPAVFHRPGNGLRGHYRESVLFKVMPNFCSHGVPSEAQCRWAKNQCNSRKKPPSTNPAGGKNPRWSASVLS